MKSSLYVPASIAMLACAHGAHSAAAPPNLHDMMKNVVAAQTQIIWDVGNQAQDDHGNPDATKLKADDWSKITNAAGKVRQVAATLAQADHVVAAAPGTKLGDQETPGAFGVKEMQAAIDADPAAFRALAQTLSVSMDQIVAAAKAKDAAKLFDVSGGLDQVCESCHMQFWYPEQKASR